VKKRLIREKGSRQEAANSYGERLKEGESTWQPLFDSGEEKKKGRVSESNSCPPGEEGTLRSGILCDFESFPWEKQVFFSSKRGRGEGAQKS